MMADQRMEERLEGAWALVSWTISFDDGRDPVEPFGPRATGRIHYAPDQVMTATMMSSDHASTPPHSVQDPGILGRYMHYTGTWRVEGDCVMHRVDFALDPALIGRDLARRVRFEGDDLILTGTDHSPRSGRVLHHEVRWRRV